MTRHRSYLAANPSTHPSPHTHLAERTGINIIPSSTSPSPLYFAQQTQYTNTTSPLVHPTQYTSEAITKSSTFPSPFNITLDNSANSHPCQISHLNYNSMKISSQLCTKTTSPISQEYLIKTLKPPVRRHQRNELLDVIVAATLLMLSSWKDGVRQKITLSETKNVVQAFDGKISTKEMKNGLPLLKTISRT